MNKKHRKQLNDHLDRFLHDMLSVLGRSERRDAAAQYVQGLLSEFERKTAFTIGNRFGGLDGQAIQQLLQASPWDPLALHQSLNRKAIAELKPTEVLVIDDTGFPKRGTHSVGVARQYSGTLGKVDNCQVAVSLHYATASASFPLGWSLYLPEAWIADPVRRKKARIPDRVVFRKKWELALDLLDTAVADGIAPGIVIADAGYGVGKEFRDGLTARQLQYNLGITEIAIFFRVPTQRKAVPGNGKYRGKTYYRYDRNLLPEAASAIAVAIPETGWETIEYGKGTRKPLRGRFAALRVQPAAGYDRDEPEEPMHWLLIQKLDDPKQPYKYFLSNQPESTSVVQLVKTAKMRWRIESDYERLKGEVGLDHYEGRSWPGWYHHVALATMAYLFLTIERLNGEFPPSNSTIVPVVHPTGHTS